MPYTDKSGFEQRLHRILERHATHDPSQLRWAPPSYNAEGGIVQKYGAVVVSLTTVHKKRVDGDVNSLAD